VSSNSVYIGLGEQNIHLQTNHETTEGKHNSENLTNVLEPFTTI